MMGFVWHCRSFIAAKTGWRGDIALERSSRSLDLETWRGDIALERSTRSLGPHDIIDTAPSDRPCIVPITHIRKTELTKQRATATRLASVHAPVASSSHRSSSLTATHVQDRTTVSDGTTDLRCRIFDQRILRREELASYAVDMFQNLSVLEALGISQLDMLNMVQTTEKRYHDNPYHNFRHAFDVLQAMYHLLHETGLAFTATKVELFALMATALLHDGAFANPVVSLS